MARGYWKCANCGQEQVLNARNSAEAANKAAWYEKQGNVCGTCYNKQKAAYASKKTQGLPTLMGSEKQVAWAERIRAEHVDKIEHAKEALLKRMKAALPENIKMEVENALKVIAHDLLHRKKAAEWIDARDAHYDTVIAQELKKRQKELVPSMGKK